MGGFKPRVPPFKFLFSLKFGFVANAANPSGGHSVLSDGAELLRHKTKVTLLDQFWEPKNHKKVTRTIFKGWLHKCVVKRAYIHAAKCNVHIADFVVNFQSGLH